MVGDWDGLTTAQKLSLVSLYAAEVSEFRSEVGLTEEELRSICNYHRAKSKEEVEAIKEKVFEDTEYARWFVSEPLRKEG